MGLGLAMAETPDEVTPQTEDKAKVVAVPKGSMLEVERAALKAVTEGDVKSAQGGFDTLVKNQPNRLDYRHRLAAMNALNGKAGAAEAQAAAAVALRPDFETGKRLAVTSRGWRDARSTTRTPGVADVRVALGEGRIRTAARWADQAMATASTTRGRGELHRERARALLALGQQKAAQDALKQAGADGQTDASMWFELGESALQLGTRDAARFYFEMAAEVGGANNTIAEQARVKANALRPTRNP